MTQIYQFLNRPTNDTEEVEAESIEEAREILLDPYWGLREKGEWILINIENSW